LITEIFLEKNAPSLLNMFRALAYKLFFKTH